MIILSVWSGALGPLGGDVLCKLVPVACEAVRGGDADNYAQYLYI